MFTLEDVRAIVIPPIGDNVELINAQYLFRVLGHTGKLILIRRIVNNVMVDNHVMLIVDNRLAIVSDLSPPPSSCDRDWGQLQKSVHRENIEVDLGGPRVCVFHFLSL